MPLHCLHKIVLIRSVICRSKSWGLSVSYSFHFISLFPLHPVYFRYTLNVWEWERERKTANGKRHKLNWLTNCWTELNLFFSSSFWFRCSNYTRNSEQQQQQPHNNNSECFSFIIERVSVVMCSFFFLSECCYVFSALDFLLKIACISSHYFSRGEDLTVSGVKKKEN